MKRVYVHIHRAVPGALMAAAVAIPFTTTVEILVRFSDGSTTAALTPGLAGPGPGPGPGPGLGPAIATSRMYVGPVEYIRSGAVQATITVAGGKVIAVAILAPEGNPRSAYINARAIPILRSETLQAQSTTIAIVSGATSTSEAYEQSLQEVLNQAHLP